MSGALFNLISFVVGMFTFLILLLAIYVLLIYHSGEQRAQLWNCDKGKCNHCGCENRTWHADHIKPLVEQKHVKAKDLDWSYYSLDNLQTLCKSCHRKKTNSEVKLRGKKKPVYKKWSK